LTGKKPLNGYLDRLRENIEVLDEQIENARKMSKPNKKGDRRAALQSAKILRDLVELRNETLDKIKVHLSERVDLCDSCYPKRQTQDNLLEVRYRAPIGLVP